MSPTKGKATAAPKAKPLVAFFITERQRETMLAIAKGRRLKLTKYQWATFEAMRQRGLVAGGPDAAELTAYGELVLQVIDTHERNMARVPEARRFHRSKKKAKPK